jgi:tetratricopeptide (TPR) repeat protein
MNETEIKVSDSANAKKLRIAQASVEKADYQGALSILKEAKGADPTNIYLLAFEKQVEQLHELSGANKLSDEQRADIIESLPGIIERATAGPGSQGAAPASSRGIKSGEEQHIERRAALEWLKNQYFQHAHDYVKKGEYENALAEVRRVFIIDPESKIAQDFERQIRELSELKNAQIPDLARKALKSQNVAPPGERRHVPPPASVAPPAAAHPAIIPDAAAKQAHRSQPPPVPVAPPVATHPAIVPDAAVKPPHEGEHRYRRVGIMVVVAALVATTIIGYIIFFLMTRPQSGKRASIDPKHTIAPQSEVFYADTASAREQTFVISVGDSLKADQQSGERNQGPAALEKSSTGKSISKKNH